MGNVIDIFSGTQIHSKELKKEQLQLFEKENAKSYSFDVFDVRKSDQDGLLRKLSSDGIKAVLDMRLSAAFPRFSYDHKQVFEYFDKYKISYFIPSAMEEEYLSILSHKPFLMLIDSAKNVENEDYYRRYFLTHFDFKKRM